MAPRLYRSNSLLDEIRLHVDRMCTTLPPPAVPTVEAIDYTACPRGTITTVTDRLPIKPVVVRRVQSPSLCLRPH